MERKNKELAKENVGLRGKIAAMEKVQAELLKDSIKREYYGSRAGRRVFAGLEKNIAAIEEVLESLKELRKGVSKSRIRQVLEDKSNLQGDVGLDTARS